MCRF
jgi:GMP synthase-like glutamine amidotransferase